MLFKIFFSLFLSLSFIHLIFDKCIIDVALIIFANINNFDRKKINWNLFFFVSEASRESRIVQAQHHPIIGRAATVISNDAFIGILSNASSTLTAMEICRVNF